MISSEIVRQRFFRLVEIVHFRIFGHEMSGAMRSFVKNLSWSFFGGVMASFAMLCVNVLGGRYMGPEDYGFYGLVLTISQFIMIPLVFGMDISGMRALSRSRGIEEKSKNITATIAFIIVSHTLVAVFLVYFFDTIQHLFSLNSMLFFIAIIYSFLFSLRSIVDAFLRGFSLFRAQFYARILELSSVLALFLFLFFFTRDQTYVSYISALVLGSLVFTIFSFLILRKYIVGPFRIENVKDQLSYALVIILGLVLSTAFGVLDKLIIAKYLSVRDLGIYMAYFTASINLVAQVMQIFTNVFFPSIASIKDYRFMGKVEKILFAGFLPIFLSICLFVFGIVMLFGSEYDINILYIVSFGFLGALHVVSTTYFTIIMARSKTLYKRYVVLFNVVDAVHLVGYFLMITFNMVSIEMIVFMFIANASTMILFERSLLFHPERRIFSYF